jgi:hypothetical protein
MILDRVAGYTVRGDSGVLTSAPGYCVVFANRWACEMWELRGYFNGDLFVDARLGFGWGLHSLKQFAVELSYF